MGRLLVAVVAVMATLALSSVASAKGEGAVTLKCEDHFGLSGTIVLTPSGRANFNCDVPGPSEGGGVSDRWSCSEVFGPDVKGDIFLTPSGHFKSHCNFPASE